MIEHGEMIVRAKEAWQDAAPSDDEIRRGAERIARRLHARPKVFVKRPMLVFAGACAAFLAALAYASSQKWIELPHHHERDSRASTVPSASSLPESAPSPRLESATPKATPPAIEDETPSVAAPLPSVEPAPRATALPTTSAPLPPPRANGKEAQMAAPSNVPSWGEVKDALSDGDEAHAQKLLSDLARRGHDANDRAKAKLGLAQLEAAHGNCSRARVLALQVAAIQDIELKTVRRALELATHCAQ
jgi:hypothetical protein